MSENTKNNFLSIKKFLFDSVYNNPKFLTKRNESEEIVINIFNYFKKNFHKLPKDWLNQEKFYQKERIICDYISGMTDRYAFKLYKSIYE